MQGVPEHPLERIRPALNHTVLLGLLTSSCKVFVHLLGNEVGEVEEGNW